MNLELIQFPKIVDLRGNLTFLQNPHQLPFEIKRVFWTYDVPGGENRGGHAYKTQQEVIIALSGSFDVIISEKDGSKKKISMNRSYSGLYIPAKVWRHMENFSTNSLALHISDSVYNEDDYVRDKNSYIKNERF